MQRLGILFALLLALLADAASAATVRLRENDHGAWGATLRACKNRIPRSQCANILPLVLKDSGISTDQLTRLPVGKRIVVDETYLNSAFRPNRETVEEAKAIFGQSVSFVGNSAEVAQLQQAIDKLKAEKESLASELQAANTDNQKLRVDTSLALAKVTATEQERNALQQQLAAVPQAKPWWLVTIMYAVVFALGAGATFVLCLWWFKVFERKNRILPQFLEVEEDSVSYGFRLRDDNTYDCLNCEARMKAEGMGARERGKRIKFENLEQHVEEVEHDKFELRDPIVRTA